MISKVKWQKRIEEHKLSGLSIIAWCKIQNISISSKHTKKSESEKIYRIKAYLPSDKAELEKYHTRVRS